MLDNGSDDPEQYRTADQKLNEIVEKLEAQMENKTITFEKNAEDQIVLRKDGKASDAYVIRYTLDGTIPRKDANEYKTPISLLEGKSTLVRAALYCGTQRISPVYTKNYATGNISFKDVAVSHTNDWGASYTKEKMIDQDPSTRWASKQPDATKSVDITLNFQKKEMLNKMKFDLFVSSKNEIAAFEIQALVDGNYKKIYEHERMGGLADKEGALDGASGGYHAYHTAEFAPVFTESVKIIMKPGYVGEPSIYEVTAFAAETAVNDQKDAKELQELLTLAEQADRESYGYKNAPEALKNAFEESILDAKEVLEQSQDILDARTEFLRNRYERIDFAAKPPVEPEKPQPEPEKPQPEPEKPQPEPEKPQPEPEKPQPEPEKPQPEPEKPNTTTKPETDKTPTTGDPATAMLWVALGAASLSVIGKKKKEEN